MKRKDKMAPKIDKLPAISRSFAGLRDALFDEFDNLRSNHAKPERANAAARLANEITRSVAVQAQLMRIVRQDDQTDGIEEVRALLR
jgi:hypothetical protein